jgi:GT2 family glycosyltransferase
MIKMAIQQLPISAIIPTRNRAAVLRKTLSTIALQTAQPFEIIIVDASENEESYKVVSSGIEGLESRIIYEKAVVKGAAAQRNQAIQLSSQPFIAFMDDDVYLEPGCLPALFEAIHNDPAVGGVNALIINQQFHPPGRISRMVYRLFTSKKVLDNLEGRTIGPTVNFLCSEKNKNNLILVDWLNLGLTIYRKEALPDPVFHPHFKGYSFMEDVALSFIVAKKWKLYTVRDARIYHDSQRGDHKDDAEQLAQMELVNRYFISTEIQQKKSFKNKIQFLVFELFMIITRGWLFSLKAWKGKCKGIRQIWFTKQK